VFAFLFAFLFAFFANEAPSSSRKRLIGKTLQAEKIIFGCSQTFR